MQKQQSVICMLTVFLAITWSPGPRTNVWWASLPVQLFSPPIKLLTAGMNWTGFITTPIISISVHEGYSYNRFIDWENNRRICGWYEIWEQREERIVLTLSMSGIIVVRGYEPLSNSLSGFPTQLLFLAENTGLEVICMVYNQVRSHIWRITVVCWNSMYSKSSSTTLISKLVTENFLFHWCPQLIS